MYMGGMLDRILRRIGCEDLRDRLRSLSSSDLNALLLEVFKAQAGKADARSVVKRHAQSRFSRPSDLDPVRYHLLESELLELGRRHGMTPMLLSTVAPLGSCSAFGCVSQNNVVSAARGVEVLADPTNMLALILADERKRGLISEDAHRHLCTTARVTRTQFYTGKHSFAHFGIFCIVSSGRDTGSYACETALLADQLSCYKEMFEEKYGASLSITLRKRAGYQDGDGFVDRMHERVQAQMPAVPVSVDLDGSDNAYYKGLNFKLYLHLQGEKIEIGDGGFVDWMQQATGWKKERCLISGIGLDRLMLMGACAEP